VLLEKATVGQRVEISRRSETAYSEIALDELDLGIRVRKEIVDQVLAIELV
jgi:hypothetical protein